MLIQAEGKLLKRLRKKKREKAAESTGRNLSVRRTRPTARVEREKRKARPLKLKTQKRRVMQRKITLRIRKSKGTAKQRTRVQQKTRRGAEGEVRGATIQTHKLVPQNTILLIRTSPPEVKALQSIRASQQLKKRKRILTLKVHQLLRHSCSKMIEILIWMRMPMDRMVLKVSIDK